MENKNHPTIEEVIAYFKDAEEAECLFANTPKTLSFEKPFSNIDSICSNPNNTDFFWMSSNSDLNCAVYDFETQQFAKITKYKPEINLSKITPEFVLELCKEENIKEAFEREGVLVERPKPAYIQVPISEIDNLSSKKLGRFVKELRENY